MIFFLLRLFVVQVCCEDILLVQKIFFCLNTSQLPENYFLRKMFDWPQLLVSLVKSQYLVYKSHCRILTDQELAVVMSLLFSLQGSSTVYF